LGLSLVGVACTALALAEGFTDFPLWLVGAAPGLVFSVVALVLGGITMVRAANAAMRSPEALLSVVTGVFSGLIALALIVFTVVDYGPLRDYSVCMRQATTIAGQASCQNQFIGGF
jgi:protein-S-isoprenylcysteine O-methyltransferase Ste14